MDNLTDFVVQLSAEATAAIPPPTGFPTLGDVNDNSTGALKWRDLLQDIIYQVRSARSIHTQHGTSFILSQQTAVGLLLQSLEIWYVNKRNTAESWHARSQTAVTSVYKSDWTENEQEWAGIPIATC